MRGYSHDAFSQWLHDIELILPVPHKCPPILLMHSAERCNEIHTDWAPVFCTHDQTTGEEILLRIRALLRRASGYPNHRYIGPLGLDPLTHRAYLNGWPIALRAKEIELLQALHDRNTRAVSYERLEAVVWMGKPNARARLASQIRNLRASLERQGVPITIRNVKGYGYRLVQAVPQRNGSMQSTQTGARLAVRRGAA
ncbi:hypothetical protein BJI67_01295 [Acidihalobacter aeolianus]|uniref:OmpR/PhoB-type domain-containing protein n=1 Tax=Acidihalobacter aeolianus TaxID=2792603 RepID=A0A1D8K4K3_9GAMM|nr:winged helix-turn-helix domain-containing protein [Acidihalobacter aeolianus]AOV15886.1 hypothetical protein BJI67_01295 [Acidihalobacter aeolianus]